MTGQPDNPDALVGKALEKLKTDRLLDDEWAALANLVRMLVRHRHALPPTVRTATADALRALAGPRTQDRMAADASARRRAQKVREAAETEQLIPDNVRAMFPDEEP